MVLPPRPVQSIPFVDVAIEFPSPSADPIATHNDNDGLQATPNPFSKIVVPARPVQSIPFVDVTTEFPPGFPASPTATHNEPFHATPFAPEYKL